jgi:hypothetical protein
LQAGLDMTDRLERYREMRDFSITPEPSGIRRKSKSRQLRYYIQRHDATRLHYDPRLELAWRCKPRTIRSITANSRA